MFEKFPPSIRATIEAFFNEPLFGATTDDHALDLANELEVQHPDLSCRFRNELPVKRSKNEWPHCARLVSQPPPSRPRLPLLPLASNSALAI